MARSLITIEAHHARAIATGDARKAAVARRRARRLCGEQFSPEPAWARMQPGDDALIAGRDPAREAVRR